MAARGVRCDRTDTRVVTKVDLGHALFACLNCGSHFGCNIFYATEIPPCDVCRGTDQVERCCE